MNITDFIAIASVILSVIALYISFYSFRRTLHASSKPVLIFSMNSMFRWRLENVGSGPAINLVVGDKGTKEGFVSITNCYPLSAGASLELLWIKGAYELAAVYTDVYGNTFTTICGGSNRVINKNQFPDWKPNQDQWFQMILAEGREESKLTVEDLKGKTAAELDIMRNEPYARKGYIFKWRKDLSEYFNKQSWYAPITTDQGKVFRQFSAAEKYEVHLILEYQNHNGLRTSSITDSANAGKPNKQAL